MPTKKKKKKKYKRVPKKITSPAQLAFNKMLLADAGKGMENFDKPATPVNVYAKAKSVKNYRELQGFIARFAPSVTEADLAKMAADHVSADWLENGILKDSDHEGAVKMLLEYMTTNTVVKTYSSRHLKRFCMWTGYKKPTTLSTFKNHMTRVKIYWGDKRAKKKVPHSKDKEFKI